MIKAGSGWCDDANTATAANHAARACMAQLGEIRADVVFLFSSSHHCKEYSILHQVIRTVCGTDAIVGCSGAGVISAHEEMEDGPGVAVMAIVSNQVQLHPFLIESKTSDPAVLERTIQPLLANAVGPKRLLVVFPDPTGVDTADFVRSVERFAPGVPIVGAVPSGRPSFRSGFEWLGPKICQGGVSGFLMSGNFETHVGTSNGCQPIGEPFIVTKANRNIVYEIGRQPAASMLQQALETVPYEDLERERFPVFAGIAIDESKEDFGRGDFLVRNLVRLDPDSGSISVAGGVRQGQTIQFHLRDVQAAMDDMREKMAHLASGLDEELPLFGLYFNCFNRGYGLYERRNFDTSVMREFLGNFPLIGLNGCAEIAPAGARNLVHHYAGVLVLIK